MCWRVVRITGNNSIKLILANYNPNNVENPCQSNQDESSRAFARYSGNTYLTAYNQSAKDNKHFGFMFGGAVSDASTSRAQATTNQTSSTIKTNLETWYVNKLQAYSSYLDDSIWCNDRQLQSEVGGEATGTGFGNSVTKYAGCYRVYTSKTPSLKCGLKNDRFTVSDTSLGNGALTYPIGLLTVDELAFAGAIQPFSNTSYYLYKNASSDFWSLLTPNTYYADNYAKIFRAYKSGYIDFYIVDSYSLGGLRPAITLKSTTKVAGSGIASNPYIIA